MVFKKTESRRIKTCRAEIVNTLRARWSCSDGLKEGKYYENIIANSQKSLDERGAIECKKYAIDYAITQEEQSYGGGVSVEHFDRALPMGTEIGRNREEIFGLVNFEVTLHRESADPIVHEMSVGIFPKGKKVRCKMLDHVTRALL